MPVATFDLNLEKLVLDLKAELRNAPGYGLAAPQIGIPQQVFVINPTECGNKDLPEVFVNPKITTQKGRFEHEEGCLSFPSVFVKTWRAAEITVAAQDVTGKPIRVDAEGQIAAVLQHETDHLHGKLLIDFVPRGLRTQITREVQAARWRR